MQIRKSIFETNSSSSHSIVVSDGADYELPVINEDEIIVGGGEYGWGYEKLVGWLSIAKYLATYALINGKEKDVKLLKLVIEDFTDKKVIFNVNLKDDYIDHQSIDVAEEAFKDYAKLKQVIFGKGSYIIIDNDNH
jgi:hypothetical protein